VSRQPGPLLASGRSADVFERDAGLVLRRYRSPRDTEGEAAIMRYAEAHGFPVPRVHEASATDIVMERIGGRPLQQSPRLRADEVVRWSMA
jgi:RIO-like serine/threonine protein kinase